MPETEPEIWRWIDFADGHHNLVAGEGPLPGPRVILACGDVDSTDQDVIAAAPEMIAVLSKVASYLRVQNGGAMGPVAARLYESVQAALAKVRRDGKPEPEPEIPVRLACDKCGAEPIKPFGEGDPCEDMGCLSGGHYRRGVPRGS